MAYTPTISLRLCTLGVIIDFESKYSLEQGKIWVWADPTLPQQIQRLSRYTEDFLSISWSRNNRRIIDIPLTTTLYIVSPFSPFFPSYCITWLFIIPYNLLFPFLKKSYFKTIPCFLFLLLILYFWGPNFPPMFLILFFDPLFLILYFWESNF